MMIVGVKAAAAGVEAMGTKRTMLAALPPHPAGAAATCDCSRCPTAWPLCLAKRRCNVQRCVADVMALVGGGVLTTAGLQATKRLWQVIKERDLPKDKRGSYILDDEMQSVFKRKTLNFKSSAKALSAQMYDTKFSSRNVDWAHDGEGTRLAAAVATAVATMRQRHRGVVVLLCCNCRGGRDACQEKAQSQVRRHSLQTRLIEESAQSQGRQRNR